MKPWMLLSPKRAHDLMPIGLQLLSAFRETHIPVWSPFTWRGLEFKNRLGIAGGVDKDGELIEEWWTFGPGFIEIGTVTPKPQGPNDGRIVDRDLAHRALWNRMGFPSKGAWYVRANLTDLPKERATPIFVNIGKNRTTSNEAAVNDYIECIDIIGDLADAWVINISSPNTPGLRDLFKPEKFHPFLEAIIEARTMRTRRRAPVLLKLSPDLSAEDLEFVIATAVKLGIDGFIATNTTLAREPGLKFPNEGGVSGQPLAKRSKEVLRQLIALLGSARHDFLIVSVGGVMDTEDVRERISLGADLVQVYSTLVFEGPWFFSRVAEFMTKEREDRNTNRV